MIRNPRNKSDAKVFYEDEIKAYQIFIQDFLVRVVDKARIQGDPIGNFDEAVKINKARQPISRQGCWMDLDSTPEK